MNIQGVCPVLSVPFHKSGEVDYQSFKSLVSWITSLGTQSVLFFGVASENIKLLDDERYKLLEILLTQRSDSGMKVIASVADHSAELAVKRAKDYEKMGVDFINILPPTFFNPTTAQINHHISAIPRADHRHTMSHSFKLSDSKPIRNGGGRSEGRGARDAAAC